MELTLTATDNLNDIKHTTSLRISDSVLWGTATDVLHHSLRRMELELVTKKVADYAEVADAAARLIVALDGTSPMMTYLHPNPLTSMLTSNYKENYKHVGSFPVAVLDRLRRALQKLDLPNSKQRYA